MRRDPPTMEAIWRVCSTACCGDRGGPGAAAVRTVEALRPVLKKWIRRKKKPLFSAWCRYAPGMAASVFAQVAKREESPRGHEYGAAEDTAQDKL